MDAFRLLSRSTNLQRSHKPKSDQAQNIPSATNLSSIRNSDGGGEGNWTDQALASRGKKRKRHSGRGLNGSLEATSAANGRHLKSQGEYLNWIGRDTAAEATSSEQHQSKVDESSTVPEEECREILRKHKLKITILKGSERDGEGQARSKSRRRKEQEKDRKDRLQLSPQPLTSFVQLRSKYGISRRLYDNIMAQGYGEPTEVQMGSLPLLLGSDKDRRLPKPRRNVRGSRSDVDLLTIAPTGSGKTLAFLVPTIQAVLDERHQMKDDSRQIEGIDHSVKALIVAPTHELADQIADEGRRLAAGTGIKVSAMRKGMSLQSGALEGIVERGPSSNNKEFGQASKAKSFVKADIVVSTPLLLKHAISSDDKTLTNPLPSVRHLILDEADVLLDDLFCDQTMSIWNACTSPALHTSLWSATINSSIETLAQNHILDRRKLLITPNTTATTAVESPPVSSHYIIRLVVGLKDTSLPTITHRLIYSASERGKLLALRQLLNPASAPSPSIPPIQPPFLIFTQTIPRATALYNELLYDIPPEAGGSSRIAVLHSELSDTVRAGIMAGVRKGEIWVLITTDLLSRGVDFRGMNGVVNFDIPTSSAAYVHRAGRTGRQGREGGVAVTLYTREDIPFVKNVANVIAMSERARGGGGDDEGGGQQWLLDALPDVSKKTKRELKRKGVESRRKDAAMVDPAKAKKARISTKSGYDRKVENRRKGAAQRSRELLIDENMGDEGGTGDSGGEWAGFD